MVVLLVLFHLWVRGKLYRIVTWLVSLPLESA